MSPFPSRFWSWLGKTSSFSSLFGYLYWYKYWYFLFHTVREKELARDRPKLVRSEDDINTVHLIPN